MEPASVVVLAEAPRPGRCKRSLEPRLGPNGCALLQAELIRVAVAWGRTLGPVAVAITPPDAVDEIEVKGATVFAQEGADPGARIAAAVDRADGPAVGIGTDLPTLGASHADAVRSDLVAGVDVAVGPSHDGGWYLVALRSPRPELFALPGGAWNGPEGFTALLGRATELRLGLGMLRGERKLETPADADALLLHHALPAAVAERLRVRPA
jgi:glycosyltransferase A (GT-A) superfamily protein (DUF2064 family)